MRTWSRPYNKHPECCTHVVGYTKCMKHEADDHHVRQSTSKTHERGSGTLCHRPWEQLAANQTNQSATWLTISTSWLSTLSQLKFMPANRDIKMFKLMNRRIDEDNEENSEEYQKEIKSNQTKPRQQVSQENNWTIQKKKKGWKIEKRRIKREIFFWDLTWKFL